ncbi:MAG: ABC transporter permease [Lachnospiraceae bacterium]|jgi:ribose transport system permease protein|nr:ABC transporter permease [Lachnospiraceae bacterium]
MAMDKSKVEKIIKEYALIGFLVILCIFIYIVEPRFISRENLINVLIQIAINAFIATGMTFVLLTGGIDLSVGPVCALNGILGALLCKQLPAMNVGMTLLVGLLLSIAIALVIGGISAFIICRFNVAPFIATLAMMNVARGVCYLLTNSKPVYELPESFLWIGQGYIGPIPFIVILTIVVLLISHIILSKTAYGRHIYAVGSNEEVAKLSGIRVNKIKTSVYMICAGLSAFAGICQSAKIGTGQPGAAEGYEQYAIAAAVMGGTSLAGGTGGIPNTIIGIIAIGIINNGLSLMQVNSYWQKVAMGVIIAFAVIMDRLKVKAE